MTPEEKENIITKVMSMSVLAASDLIIKGYCNSFSIEFEVYGEKYSLTLEETKKP